MRASFWIFPGILFLLVAVSFINRQPPTAGEQLLNTLAAHHLAARQALLLIDYKPDPALVTAARDQQISRGQGAAPGYNLDALLLPSQSWLRCGEATFTWHSAKSAGNLLRAALTIARQHIAAAIFNSPLDSPESTAQLADAEHKLASLSDERLLLAWINADRGILGDLNNPSQAFQQAILLLARPNPGPVLMFSAGSNHVYLLPLEVHPGEAWCEMDAYNLRGELVLSGTLRVQRRPKAQEVRTLAFVLAREALRTPSPEVKQTTTTLIPLLD